MTEHARQKHLAWQLQARGRFEAESVLTVPTTFSTKPARAGHFTRRRTRVRVQATAAPEMGTPLAQSATVRPVSLLAMLLTLGLEGRLACAMHFPTLQLTKLDQ